MNFSFFIKTFFILILLIRIETYGNTKDPHSYANYEEVQVTHMDFTLNLDFEQQLLNGIIKLKLMRKNKTASLILDTFDLNIKNILLISNEGKKTNTQFKFHDKDPNLGSALEIQLSEKTVYVEIEYTTNNTGPGFQWLSKDLTLSKQPFFFTQSESIGARSWFPCQDSPAVRATYTASVKVSDPSLIALMSAENPVEVNPNGLYSFKMDIPIPSYLIVLVSGNIKFKSLGRRSGVYADPLKLEEAAHEFEDIEKYINIAESLLGEFKWGRFDMLVMPFSFPYGGMENPRLTFVSDSIIVGDKSQMYTVAHELSHYWAGNATTNANWNEFWLNEAVTTYFEKRIIEKVNGKSFLELEDEFDWISLNKDINIFHKDDFNILKLKMNLVGRHPDEGFTGIPYNKGYRLLRYLEEFIGRKKFDKFWINYFKKYYMKSITTELFLSELQSFSQLEHLNLDWFTIDSWIYDFDFPKSYKEPQSEQITKIYLLKNELSTQSQELRLTLQSLTPTGKILLLFKLVQESNLVGNSLDFLYQSLIGPDLKNKVILKRWYELCSKLKNKKYLQGMEEFLKFAGSDVWLKPIYENLLNSEDRELIDFAKRVYKENRINYFPSVQNTLDKIFNTKI